MPTYHVVKKAIDIGANLLICHEGAFYSHHDSEIKSSAIFKEKEKLIKDSGIVICRYMIIFTVISLMALCKE